MLHAAIRGRACDFVLGTVTWAFLIGSALVPALVRLHRARSPNYSLKRTAASRYGVNCNSFAAAATLSLKR